MKEELAKRRLDAKIGMGMMLGHDFILKEHPQKQGRMWRDSHWDFEKKIRVDDGPNKFSYCPDCKNWAWALPIVCRVKYRKSYQEELNELTEINPPTET